MYLYEDQFSEKHDSPRTLSPKKYLVIASTPRSGSHMLGHALRDCGKFGVPLEYVNPSNLKAWGEKFNVHSLSDVLSELKARRTSESGVFSIKIHYEHIKQFGDFDSVRSQFPDAYYIHIYRSNYLSQAISLYIAKKTGVWIDGQESSGNFPDYNYFEIDACLQKLLSDNSRWLYFLAGSGVNYISMDFENIKKDISAAVGEVSRFTGVDAGESLTMQASTKRQSSTINEEWARQFVKDHSRYQGSFSSMWHQYMLKANAGLRKVRAIAAV